MPTDLKDIKVPKFNFLYPLVIVGVVLLLTSSFVTVQSGHVGVVRTLGAVQPNALPEGFHLKKPYLDKVEQMDIRLTKAVVKSEAASKESPDVNIISSRSPLLTAARISGGISAAAVAESDSEIISLPSLP